MELRTLNTFLKVAELRSFSRAAVQLGYSQSTVTTHIQLLESELGVQLFDRINKTVRLTQYGETLSGYARDLTRTAAAATAAMQTPQALSGELRIAMAESLCSTFFPQILRRFHQVHPNVALIVRTGGTSDMFDMLQHNEVDFFYTLDRRLFQTDFMKFLDVEEPVCFVTSPRNPLAAQQTVTTEQILSQELILTERGMSYRDVLTETLAKDGLELRPFLEVGNTDLICKLLTADIGVSYLPEYLIRSALECGTLSKLNVPTCHLYLWRQLFCHRDKWITPQMQAMIDLMQSLETPTDA
ncbi:MAG: LysR family transcriptional regulator [Oscillospiraceae bacterium]|nr:LysR family transcriptional regulator [Oscillospiraceae bacterium]